MTDLFRMINNVNMAYEHALSECRRENNSREMQLFAMEGNYQTQKTIDEIRARSNRRERCDDEGNIIPFEEEEKDLWMLSRDKNKEEVSWICDKCMAINFGCQTACPECGDIKDRNDEELK